MSCGDSSGGIVEVEEEGVALGPKGITVHW